jgi:hypothetical protein
MPDWKLIAPISAIIISIISLLWNWHHSESLFRRTEYPAVAWYLPRISKEGNNTAIATDVRNYGPKGITSISLGAYLCRSFKVKAWCKSEQIDEIPIGEKLVFHVTEELEKDITERFGEPLYDNFWKYKIRIKRFKIIFRIEYLPLIADTQYYARKAYYLVQPVVQNGIIASWGLKPIPTWLGWVPSF